MQLETLLPFFAIALMLLMFVAVILLFSKRLRRRGIVLFLCGGAALLFVADKGVELDLQKTPFATQIDLRDARRLGAASPDELAQRRTEEAAGG